MAYLKYVAYMYLIMAGFFVYSGVMGIIEKETPNAIISFVFAGAAVFMFFFRRKFQDKIQNGQQKR